MRKNLLIVTSIAAVSILGSLFGNNNNERVVKASAGCNGAVITNDLTPAGACIAAALESGQINFNNPSQAVLQIAQICVGVTAEGIFAALTSLINATNQIADGGTIGAPLPNAPLVTVSQLALVANAASKLHGTYAEMVAAGAGK